MNRCAYVIQGLIVKRGQGLEFEFGGRCMQGRRLLLYPGDGLGPLH